MFVWAQIKGNVYTKSPPRFITGEVSELPVIAGKLWHLFCLSSYFTPGYWLPPLSSKSLKSFVVVTVIPARCCRLHFDVRDSLQDLGVVKCNCTEPKTKWQIFFLFPPPRSFGLVLIVLVVRATGFMWTCLCSQCHSSLSCVTITALQMDFTWRGAAAGWVNDRDGICTCSQHWSSLY